MDTNALATRPIGNARSGYHRERRFILKLISAFQLITTYNSRIKLSGYFELHPGHQGQGQYSALLELGRKISYMNSKSFNAQAKNWSEVNRMEKKLKDSTS